jgi:hypothetical protein
MSRRRHPKKAVEEAVQYAEAEGWTVELGGAHAWGKMYCPYNDEGCRCGDYCITSIWSTPRNPDTHARQLKRAVDNCTTHQREMEAEAKRTGSE